MTTKLGWIGTMIGAAGLLVAPAVAQQRGQYRNGNQQGYTQNTPTYTQQYAAPSYQYQQGYAQQYSRGTESYGRQYAAPAYESYGGSYRSDDRESRREHERREHDRDRWEHRRWDWR